jgi:hypothetical protein
VDLSVILVLTTSLDTRIRIHHIKPTALRRHVPVKSGCPLGGAHGVPLLGLEPVAKRFHRAPIRGWFFLCARDSVLLQTGAKPHGKT